MKEILEKLSEYIPPDVLTTMENNRDTSEKFTSVYRVAKTGKIETYTFDSTYEEIQKRDNFIQQEFKYSKHILYFYIFKKTKVQKIS